MITIPMPLHRRATPLPTLGNRTGLPPAGFTVPTPAIPKLEGADSPPSALEAGDARPRVRNDARLIVKLAGAGLFREFRRAFEDSTGLPLTLRAAESWQVAHGDSRRQNGFCALMARRSSSCSACLQMQARVCAGAADAARSSCCSFGITESAVAVKNGRDVIGYLQTGQVFLKPPTPGQTRRALARVKAWGLDLPPEQVAQAYEQTPVVDRVEYLARVRLLQFFAGQLGAMANQILLQEQNAEPEQIARARRFIEQQYREDLSLESVARHTGMSRYYFCKQFVKITGVPFTRYLSGVRVEKAKGLLLNPNYRVSEIAFEVGFQSLTHFNRIFRRVAGVSPTEFRRKLPAC